MEKSLPLPVEQQAPRHAPKSYIRRFVSLLLITASTLYLAKPLIQHAIPDLGHSRDGHYPSNSQCIQPGPLFPPTGDKGLDDLWDYLSTEAFQNASIARHSGAVQIPTQSFDDMGAIGKDKRWDIMYKFAEYLEKTFPRVHNDLQVEKVNTHGLVYTWQGSDDKLKPLLLMAHQDVVPVPDSTVSAWTHPPFSGFYDGKFIWGRGSSDCKNQLIAILESLEIFLEAGFEPKRTIVVSLGFDEEISGTQGAGHLAPFLIERYGENGVAAIVDEGAGITNEWDTTFATPGVGEKGYTDVHITIRTPGGHSSVPSDHTSIGILSELITLIESEQYPTYLEDNNPFLGLLQCGASHGKEFPKKLRKLLGERSSSRSSSCNAKSKPDYLALEAAKIGKMVQYVMQTSQAVDVIGGGVKVNALPERTSATVNHRINIGDTPETVWNHLAGLAAPVAKKYNLTFHAFDGVEEEPSSVSLSAVNTTLRVAPVTPTNVDTLTPYAVLAATTRALYGEDVIVAPGITTGNTDTRYYWPLTKNIFRYGPGYDPTWDQGFAGIHTVDERISAVSHFNMVKWFTLFIRNVDGADLK